jgi:hypothetical protein
VECEVTGRGWWVVDLLCGLLDRDERAAVCGDLVEANASTGRAVLEVGGLVIRRQAALWLGWRPWLALVTIVVPLGFLLSVSSRWFADAIAAHLWLYIRLGEWSYLTFPGWRRDVIDAVTITVAGFATLAVWSWTAGYVLARLSRRAWWTLGFALVLAIVFGTIGSATIAGGVHLTPIVRVVLVLLPAWSGLRRGITGDTLGAVRALVITVAAIALTAFMSKALEGSLTYGWELRPQPGPDRVFGTEDDLRPLWWISLVMMWPAVFVGLTRGRASQPSR